MNGFLADLRARLVTLDGLFRERTLRERALLGAGFAACVFLAIDHFGIQTVTEARRDTATRCANLREEIAALKVELASLEQVTLTAEERRQADQIEQLRKQIAEIDARISREIAVLVTPEAIVSVLEEVLAETPDLALVSLESQAPERIGARAADDPDDGLHHPGGGLYRHGLKIELEGTFPAAVTYLERLEASQWHLLWDRFDLRVQQFPIARISLELHTISQDEEWIGV